MQKIVNTVLIGALLSATATLSAYADHHHGVHRHGGRGIVEIFPPVVIEPEVVVPAQPEIIVSAQPGVIIPAQPSVGVYVQPEVVVPVPRVVRRHHY